MNEEKAQVTTFDSGAIRDIHGSKGRFDLLPHDVIAYMLYHMPKNEGIERAGMTEDIFTSVYCFRLHGNVLDLYFAAEVYFNMKAKKLDVPLEKARIACISELARHYEHGLQKYPIRNWEKGIPVSSFIDSALRHFMKWCDGQTDEAHDAAFLWNIAGAIWTTTHKAKFNDFSMTEEEYNDFLSYHEGVKENGVAEKSENQN